MRRLLIALGLVGLVSPAFAADYELPTLRGSETFVPAFPTYFRWEGFYAGGHLTYGDASADFSAATQPLIAFSLRNTTLEAQAAPSQLQVLGMDDASSAGFGGFVGYNGQFDNAVVGLELNYTHSSFNTIASNSPIDRGLTAGGHNYDVAIGGSGSMNLTDCHAADAGGLGRRQIYAIRHRGGRGRTRGLGPVQYRNSGRRTRSQIRPRPARRRARASSRKAN